MERAVYRPLSLRPVKTGTTCRQPCAYDAVQPGTPAIEVMTDFQRVSPVTIRCDATLVHANNAMLSRSVRFLFVVDEEDEIIGVITARDINGERPVKLIRERGGKYGDLCVEDVMTRQRNMEALTLADVLHAEVGHILQTLKQIGRQHAIVVETDPRDGKETVRGIFSATAIGRRLGVPVHTFEVANTFAEIEAALATT
ncbi:MAG TPA: CBS domain-containing protein [Rhodocyclaceae bacterium]|nr:CBS domain-containing protein [Rhodocyclaceae bacterium]